ncbi:MAG: UDP-N-acetylmuramate dehydrogenase [Acidobacteriota bacterium]|mgnify:CR=1 FL=1|jgi:UDP-N-acetylmuramate dehydrogenase|nr:UDP-N-acetylmuramate dehydrogenase [Acidobacteriota bacterium]NLT32108.1 UDP-N-acetylmuramate dehydrogenase [Acidobacteriota bacterium]
MQEERTRWTIEENVPLAPYTTIGVGGPARFFARVADEAGLMDSLAFARARACPIFVLGGGSNLVVSDRGFEGLVLKMEIAGVRTGADGATLHAGAGTEWDLLVRHAVERRLAGIECLGGIPGTVGAVPIQNVGAYGQEAGDVIAGVRAWDLEGGSFRRFDRDACAFGYRSSLFNRPGGRRYIIVEASFRLRPGGEARIDYPDLRKRFAGLEGPPSLAETRDAVLAIRRAKGMIWSPGDPESRSAGSFFKNPILPPATVEALADALGPGAEPIPRFPVPGGGIKVPAAWLITHAGLGPHTSSGGAAISARHALAIVNRGGATSGDILELMAKIRSRVREAWGVDLEPEPIFVGFEPFIS